MVLRRELQSTSPLSLAVSFATRPNKVRVDLVTGHLYGLICRAPRRAAPAAHEIIFTALQSGQAGGGLHAAQVEQGKGTGEVTARSIQVFGQTGRRHSDILEEQRQEARSVHGGALRYPNAVVFWTQCDKDVLRQRVSKRVDEMLERGLIEEVEKFHKEVNLLRGEQ
ncbi:tRNA dimethylallyltransferase, partial [Frankliniella fusca]